MSEKPKLAIYWASSCGGCEISVVNLHENLLQVAEQFDFFFCPCLLDTKTAAVEKLPDGTIALTLFNGAIRTEENESMAHLLRAKSKLLIAYGACAISGGIPALSNLGAPHAHGRIYSSGPSLDNADQVTPRAVTQVLEGELRLPGLCPSVRTLADVVDVDYVIPGCPPESKQLWAVVQALIRGDQLPPTGTVLGAGQSTVCHECARTKSDKTIDAFERPYLVQPDAARCLLEQGLLCMGVATRDGCGALCPAVNMTCTGCYGAPEGVLHQGAKMAAALGSAEPLEDDGRLGDSIPDMAGSFCRYSMGAVRVRRGA